MGQMMQDHPVLFALASLLLLSGSLFFLIVLGTRLARRYPKEEEGERPGVAAVEGTVFGLMGLLIAFSFAGAAERFQKREELILQESQAIGTAFSRLEFLADPAQSEIKARMRAYLDARLAATDGLISEFEMLATRAEAKGDEVLAAAQAATKTPEGNKFLIAVIPPIDEMLDVATARKAAQRNHPPTALFVMLVVLSFGGALLIGYAMGAESRRRLVHAIMFALAVGMTLYVILDLEWPRRGIIRVDDADALLHELRHSMD